MKTTLFPDDVESPPELATTAQVRLLEGFLYRSEHVRRWTREKAETVLRACQREERIVLARAAALAKEQGGETSRGSASIPERINSACFIEQQLGAGGADELTQAVAYTLYALTDGETRRLAGYIVRVLKGDPDGKPQQKPRDDAAPPDEQVNAPGGP
jgi:hypothetical protein